MCGPAIQAAGMLAGGIMSYQQGKANQKMANAEARRMRQLGHIEESALRRKQDFELGQQQVDIAASGRSGATGSALDLAFHSKLEAERTALTMRAGHTMRADARVNEGKMANFEGKSRLVGSGFSAAGKLLDWAAEARRIPALG